MSVTPSGDFSCDITRERNAVVVSVQGELDMAASTRLGAVLGDLIEGQGNLNVVVDLHLAAKVDPAGLGVLAVGARLANRRGGQLIVSVSSDEFPRAVEAIGTAEALTVADRRADCSRHGEMGSEGSTLGEIVVDRAARQADRHLVEFYGDEENLGGSVGEYLESALREDGLVLVVAAKQHRDLFEAVLTRSGMDVKGARADARYVDLDAEKTLSLFMVDGAPDPVRFASSVGNLVGRVGGGRRVCVYGEMVAVLWAEGNVSAAIALEDLWNDLARSQRFSLLCAYPLGAFDREGTTGSFRTICQQHSSASR